MAELADAPDLGSDAARRGGSSPPPRTAGPTAPRSWRERAASGAASAGLLCGAWWLAQHLGLITALGPARLFGVDEGRLVVPFAAVALLVGLTRARVIVAAGAAAVAVLYALVSLTPLFDGAYDAWVRRDPPARGDVVVALSAGVRVGNVLDASTLERLEGALDEQRSGRADHLVLTRLPDSEGDAEADVRMLAAGAHVERIGPVLSTRDEAVKVAARAEQAAWRTVILVTAPMHARRAAAVFEAQGLRVISRPCPERLYNLPVRSPGDRVRAFHDFITEQAAWQLYAWRGWIQEGAPQ